MSDSTDIPNSTEVLGLDAVDSQVEEYIQLITTDQKSFRFTRKELSLSKTIMTSIEHDASCTELPINCTSQVMEWIAVFLRQHNGQAPPEILKPLRSKVFAEVTTEWCANFADDLCKNRTLMYDLLKASNYLMIDSLLHLCGAKVASIVKNCGDLSKIKDALLTNESEVIENTRFISMNQEHPF